MRLNELRDNPGARKSRMRVGRGIGSGKGKTGGRGVKGQTSRSGVAIKGFEGGQMPLHMRMPKRGFNPLKRKNHAWLNLDDLQAAIDEGRLDASKPIDEAVLVSAGVVRRVKDGVKLLGRGEIKAKLALKLTAATQSAVDAIQKAGGSIETAPKPEKAEADA